MGLEIVDYVKLFLIATFTFVAIDSVWLGKIAPKLYKENIGHLMADKPNFKAAGLFYALFIVGVLAFVVVPALNNDYQAMRIIGFGALFGLVTYATFDLTSQAVFKNWPTVITVIDLVWGMFITACVAVITTLVYRNWLS